MKSNVVVFEDELELHVCRARMREVIVEMRPWAAQQVAYESPGSGLTMTKIIPSGMRVS